MPYIKQEDRKYLEGIILEDLVISGPGELNYVFTRIALKYLNTYGVKYQNINDIIGALEGCKLELYRRIAVPYEEIKLRENGDV